MLEFTNVTKSFSKNMVLNNINLNIKKGEIVSILGESGSGKSTLLNVIAGFEKAQNGECMYNDNILFDKSNFVEAQNRNLGFVFQNYALFPHINVEKNIAFGISDKSNNEQNKIVKDLLELINMQSYGKKYPDELSGGQQQRVAIARVLAKNTELILFDEPFSSIDSTLKSNLITQIKNIIISKNKTAIFVTHCPREAILLSDKIAYIENGKIIQYDTPKNLITNPASKSVSLLFGKESFIFKDIEKLYI